MNAQYKFPIIKLPNDVQSTLFLIKEELKCRKLFHILHEVGLDECYFEPHLDSLIMQNLGLDDGRDETFRTYDKILERRSKKIKADHESIMKQALKVYVELMNEKKKLSVKMK